MVRSDIVSASYCRTCDKPGQGRKVETKRAPENASARSRICCLRLLNRDRALHVHGKVRSAVERIRSRFDAAEREGE